jgi:hypothetical protein
MRSLPSILAGIVATIAAIVTVPLLWVSTTVHDEDGFVALGDRVVADAELQTAVTTYLADDFVRRGLLPAALQDPAAAAMAVVVSGTIDEPGFTTAWEQTLRSLHASAFEETSGPITVDLGPLETFVVERVGERLPVALPPIPSLTAQVADEDVRDQLVWIDRSRTGWMLGLIVVLVSVATCVLGARTRGLGIARVGLGALVTSGVLWAGATLGAPVLVERAEASTPLASAWQELLVDEASESFIAWLVPIAIGGGAAVVLGLAGHALARRQARRA